MSNAVLRIPAAVAAGDVPGAVEAFDREFSAGADPWDLHLSLFPVAQRVLNPPFINPHLPKMHAICRELVPGLSRDELASFVRLEVTEYARRVKLAEIPVGEVSRGVPFSAVEESLAGERPEETARLMASFWRESGGAKFSHRMLLLGSGYLEKSLGHSISCTVFILLEALARPDRELWPVFVLLSDYFHKGSFRTTPLLRTDPVPGEEMERHLLRAVSGRGIVDLHDTITIYAIDRVKHLLQPGEQNHLVRAWIDFLADKEPKPVPEPAASAPLDPELFHALFLACDLERVHATAAGMVGSAKGRRSLGPSLVRGICGLYRGNYNPHHITGLGSLLWVLDEFPQHRSVVVTALYQYLDYFFGEFEKGEPSRG